MFLANSVQYFSQIFASRPVIRGNFYRRKRKKETVLVFRHTKHYADKKFKKC